MKTFEIYSLRNFQLYNIVLLTIVTMLGIPTQDLLILSSLGLYLLTFFIHLSHPLPSANGNHPSVLHIYELGFFGGFIYI